MKICTIGLYFPPDMGGGSLLLWNTSTSLNKLGHGVKVVTAVPHYPDGKISKKYMGKFFVKENVNGLEVFRVWVPPLRSYGFVNRLAIYISFTISYFLTFFFVGDVDAIYDLGLYPEFPLFSFPAFVHSRLRRVPWIFSSADLWPDAVIDLGFVRSKFFAKVLDFLARLVDRLADGITTINDTIKMGILRRGVPENKVHVVDISVDTEFFRPLNESELSVPTEGFKDKFVVEYSGIFGPAYDFDVVLKAAKMVESHEEVLFLIRGDGELKREIVSKMGKLMLKNVKLLGRVENKSQVVEFLNIADVLMIPLRNVKVSYTATPSKVIEYLSCGKPVVCCARGELAKLIRESGAGIVVEPGDAEALAEAILMLLRSDGTRKTMGENARKSALDRFSHDRMGRKLCNIVSSTIERKKSIHNCNH
jgi:glycosyltransferase involved in cell wall biosynthesis